MAGSMKGLEVTPAYEDLIGVAEPDGLENNNFPNRDANSPRRFYYIKT